jgi:hypothetical protein
MAVIRSSSPSYSSTCIIGSEGRSPPGVSAERSVPLENDEGKWQYAVTLRDGMGSKSRMHEVRVGAMSGKIEADEATAPREEAREKAAEARARRAKRLSVKTKNARG